MDVLKVEDSAIRVDGDRISVYDLIRYVGGKKNPHEVWKRICATYPEVLTKTENFKFSGKGQRSTPVSICKQDSLYILGLLPGAVGKSYRQAAAKIVFKFFDAPEELIQDVVDYHKHNEEAWARIKNRVLLIGANKTLKLPAPR